MVTKRIIPCLDIEAGVVVKGVKFKNLKTAGDPCERARSYYEQGADELIFLDVGASVNDRATLIDVVSAVSRQVFIPLTVGGGIRSVEDMRMVLRAGADKVSICTAALKNPRLITDAAESFGSQCVVLSLDVRRCGNGWYAYANGGRDNSGREALAWALEAVTRGAGEILVNSIDNDGMQQGFDTEIIGMIASRVSVPVIASGGAGTVDHMYQALTTAGADAALAASILHDSRMTVAEIKQQLIEKGVAIRW